MFFTETQITLEPDQLPPRGDWTIWTLKADRGAGKSTAASEWLARQARENPDTRWAIVAPDWPMANQCVHGYGDGGIVGTLYDDLQKANMTTGRVELKNGAIIEAFSAEHPDSLRGHNFHGAWLEEIGLWKTADAWRMLQRSLRLGKGQVVATVHNYDPPMIQALLGIPEGIQSITG